MLIMNAVYIHDRESIQKILERYKVSRDTTLLEKELRLGEVVGWMFGRMGVIHYQKMTDRKFSFEVEKIEPRRWFDFRKPSTVFRFVLDGRRFRVVANNLEILDDSKQKSHHVFEAPNSPDITETITIFIDDACSFFGKAFYEYADPRGESVRYLGTELTSLCPGDWIFSLYTLAGDLYVATRQMEDNLRIDHEKVLAYRIERKLGMKGK